MSKSTLKLKYFDIFNLTNYYQTKSDDITQEEEDIIDIIYETSQENKFIFSFLMLLSKGTLIYFEYNATNKKITNLFENTALSTITNELTCAELSFNSPIIVATCLNELILIETMQRPCQMINANVEGITICSVLCDSQILSIKFNCIQSTIFVITKKELKVFKIDIDKTENKSILKPFLNIYLSGIDISNIIDYSKLMDKTLFSKFSDFVDNIIIMSYITDKPITDEQIYLSYDNEEIPLNTNDLVYLNIAKITLMKKDFALNLVQSYGIDKSFVKIEFSYFYEKMFILFEGGIVCCVNTEQIYGNSNDKKDESNIYTFDDKFIFRYSLNSPNVTLTDIYVHPSSNFIVVRDSQSSYLFFDFTLNLYYIMFNSKITVKLNMSSFEQNEEVKFIKFKPHELNYFVKNYHSNIMWGNQEEFKINHEIKSVISNEKFVNNSMFFYNSRVVNGIFIEISSKFNSKNSLNPIMDEFQLLKNHLRGQNFDSSFKILAMISDTQQWIYSLFLITNKLCHHPENILLIKKHSLAKALKDLKGKNFNDEEKNNTIANIRNLCFTNIVLRCLALRQYEYAFLIIDSLQMTHLLKLLMSHCKLTKFMGVNYLACTKLEDSNENEDNIITELNKIITSTNFTLSQSNMQLLIKDIDQLIESEQLNLDYLKESNSLEINLPKYYEGLQLEIEGKFEEAKEMYRQNGLNYDYMRVEKLNKELLNQISEDSILEFNDIKLDKDI